MSQKRNLIFVQSPKMQLRSVRNQFSDLYLQNNSVNKFELAFEKGKPNPPKKQRLRIGGIGQNAITEYKFEMWRKLKSKALKWFRLAKIQLEWQRQQSSCTTRTTWAAPWKSPSIPTDILEVLWQVLIVAGLLVTRLFGLLSHPLALRVLLAAQFFRCMQF